MDTSGLIGSSRRWISVVASALVFSLVASCGESGFRPQVYDEQKWAAAITEYNAALPMQVDSITRLDSFTLPEKGVLKLHMTLSGYDEQHLDNFRQIAQAYQIYYLRSSKEMEQYKDFGFTFSYIYRDTTGAVLHQYELTPKMYR